MGIFQGDVIIKAMVDLGLQEMRKNPWLLNHAFESLRITRYISDKYGQANIDAAKEWLENNTINVYMRPRNDKDELPCVTIYPNPSNEKPEMKTMGDLSTEAVMLLPNEIGRPIPYVVQPFTPISYDQANGLLTLDINTPGIDGVVPGQVLVNTNTGMGYPVEMVVGVSDTEIGIIVALGTEIDATELAVVPEFQVYKARIEHTFNAEQYSIGCYAHGDPQNLVWLWTIVYYAILRYRETLLEGAGFSEIVVNNGEIAEAENYSGTAGGERAYVRFIDLQGQVEQSWIKAPKRYIESVVLKDTTPGESSSGIKILSNLDAPPIIDPDDESWITVEDPDDE